jgi:hypothetical protein
MPAAVTRGDSASATVAGDADCVLSASPPDATAVLANVGGATTLHATPSIDTTYTVSCARSSTSATVRVVFAESLTLAPGDVLLGTAVAATVIGPAGALCVLHLAGEQPLAMSPRGSGGAGEVFETTFTAPATNSATARCSLLGVEATSTPVALSVRNVAPGFVWALYEDVAGECFPSYAGPPVGTYANIEDVLCSADTLEAVVCASRSDGSPSRCFSCQTSLYACVRGPPAFVAAVADASGAGQIGLPPTVEAGDLLVAVVAFEDEPLPPPPAWTILIGEPLSVSLVVIYTQVASTAAPVVDVAFGEAGRALVVGAWRNVTSIVDGAVNRRTDRTIRAPALSTDGSGLLLTIGAVDYCAENGTTGTFAATAPLTLRAQAATSNCNDTAVFIGDEPVAGAGLSSTRDVAFDDGVAANVGVRLWLR